MLDRLKNLKNWHILVVLFGMAVFSAFASAHAGGPLDAEWWAGFWQGLVTEMMGAGVTFVLIEWVLQSAREIRHEQETQKKLKDRLVSQLMRRLYPERALHTLRMNGWLRDGTLQSVKLPTANLSGLDLAYADFSGADLTRANLSKSVLFFTKLKGAILTETDFSEANFAYVNLSGVDLSLTELEGATFYQVTMDETTKLPIFGNWNEAITDEMMAKAFGLALCDNEKFTEIVII